MNFMLAVCTLAILFCFVMLARNEIVFWCRNKCIDLDFESFKAGASYHQMIWDFRKWTFKQFYPSAKV